MMPANNTRIDFRTSSEMKEIIQRAADLLGTTISAFVAQHAVAAAQQVLSEHKTLLLSRRDAELFLSHLENPPEANKALRNLLKD